MTTLYLLMTCSESILIQTGSIRLNGADMYFCAVYVKTADQVVKYCSHLDFSIGALTGILNVTQV